MSNEPNKSEDRHVLWIIPGFKTRPEIIEQKRKEIHPSSIIFAFDPDPKLAHPKESDLTNRFYCGTDVLEVVRVMDDLYQNYPPKRFEMLHPVDPEDKFIIDSVKAIAERIALFRTEIHSLKNSASEFQAKTIRGLDLVRGSRRLSELFGYGRGFPVFLIAAGPSLDSQIEYLKERKDFSIIVSCGTATKKLISEGIVPDFICHIDSGDLSAVYLNELSVPDTTSLVFDFQAKVDHVKIKNRYITGGGNGIADYACSFLRIPLVKSKGGSVANFMYSFARVLLPAQIVLFGYDFRFKGDGEVHAKGCNESYGSFENWQSAKHIFTDMKDGYWTSDNLLSFKSELEKMIAESKILTVSKSDGLPINFSLRVGGEVKIGEDKLKMTIPCERMSVFSKSDEELLRSAICRECRETIEVMRHILEKARKATKKGSQREMEVASSVFSISFQKLKSVTKMFEAFQYQYVLSVLEFKRMKWIKDPLEKIQAQARIVNSLFPELIKTGFDTTFAINSRNVEKKRKKGSSGSIQGRVDASDPDLVSKVNGAEGSIPGDPRVDTVAEKQ